MLLWEEKEAFGGFSPKQDLSPSQPHKIPIILSRFRVNFKAFPCRKRKILAENRDGEGCGNSGEILREFWGVLMTI